MGYGERVVGQRGARQWASACGLFALLQSTTCWTSDRQMAALAPASDGTIERLLEKPLPREQDWFYRSTFSKADDGITRNYQNTWSQHEAQTRFAALQSTTLFYGPRGLGDPNSQSPLEKDVRAGFAQGVLRLRMDAMLRSALKPDDLPLAARQHAENIQGRLNKIKNASVPLSSGSGAARLQMGYDVFSDASKLEVVTPTWGAGVYHSRLLGSLSGSAPANALCLRVTTRVLSSASASLSYLPGGRAVEAALSRWLAPGFYAQVSSSQPTGEGSYSRYSLSMAIGF